MSILNRRDFLELLTTLGVGSAFEPVFASSGDSDAKPAPGTYRPGRIDNEYSLFLPGERESLRTPPAVSAITHDQLTAQLGNQSLRMRPDDQLDGWRLLTIATLNGIETAVFEKHVTHRGVIAYVTESKGVIAHIPKQIGQLSSVRPRQTNTPHGVKFERSTQPGPDTVGEYILNSAEDPCYENVAALGPEYIGWTLVANEEAGPQGSLYLEASGRSRQAARESCSEGVWSPDASGPLFDPFQLAFQSSSAASCSKRTLLGGYLPVADLAVWDPKRQTGYEAIVLLPLGKDATPIARIRVILDAEKMALYGKFKVERPDYFVGVREIKENGQFYLERYWNCSPQDFHVALAAIWHKWHAFHEGRMQVEIPDEWLLNAARAGITLSRCSYTGLEPTYQMGQGFYTKVPPTSHALFPVAHYAFVWAQQLWNQSAAADQYFQHYLDRYVLPNGDFAYNTHEQVEAPLNVGVFLANSARSYFYTGDLTSFEKRLPVLERMIGCVLERYEYSKATFGPGDRRRGLIWGSPEADWGSPQKNLPESHPFFYQNAVWTWRGLEQHAKSLRRAAKDARRRDFDVAASRYEVIAREMRAEIQASMAATLALCNPAMRTAGTTPFTPQDVDRDPTHLENYENHRFVEDWFLADWGDAALDRGHLQHRKLAGKQILGLGTAHEPAMTSNFMAHGTLSVLIRQDDYRPFLLSLYALVCYAADSGNRYSPEDAIMPGGRPLDGHGGLWSAVVNSALQPALGLRWLLCYEENDADICHLQKAAPKHWFAKGQTVTVKDCPTRFGVIGWSTHAVSDRQWKITVDLPKGFSGNLVIHLHPNDGRPLQTTSAGTLDGNKIIFRSASLRDAKQLRILAS